MTQYELSRAYWDFAFANPEKVTPSHAAILFFAMEHCNRLGWKEKFGFPSGMAKDAIGIKKYDTYIRYFRDLAEWGFIKIIENSKNQYSSNIISLSAIPKISNALDNAILSHSKKGESMGESNGESTGESNGESNRTINKPITKEPITNNGLSAGKKKEFSPTEKQQEDFKAFTDWMERNTPDVLTMKKPMTIEQYVTLRGEMPYAKKKNSDGSPMMQPGVPKKVVEDTLKDLQNKTSYRKTFESPFYCITRWHDRNKERK